MVHLRASTVVFIQFVFQHLYVLIFVQNLSPLHEAAEDADFPKT